MSLTTKKLWFVLGLSFPNLAISAEPVISDKDVCTRELQAISVDNFDLNLKFYSKDNCVQNAIFIYDNIDFASNIILNYSKNHLGWKNQECKSISDLSIVEINKSDLNDHVKFRNWWQGHPEVKELQALYDTDEARIYLASEENKLEYSGIIAHEVAHYWYSRMCWDNSTITSEQFAMQVQDMYRTILSGDK